MLKKNRFIKLKLKLKQIPLILLLSVILIVVLNMQGDFEQIINQVIGQNEVIDLGTIQNCRPTTGVVCSVTSQINSEKVRLAISTEKDINKIIGSTKLFTVNILISGISQQKIKMLSIQFELPGIKIKDKKYYLRLKSKDDKKRTSHWQSELSIPVDIKGRKDWLAVLNLEIAKQVFQVTYPL